MSRLVAAPHPFKVATIDRLVPDGMNLAEILDSAQPDPILRAHAHIWVGDQYVSRDHWRLVRPKPGVTVTVRVVPHGGGGGGGKNPLRTILTIAVIAAAFYFGPMLGAGLASAAGAAGGAGATVFGSLTFGQLGGAIISITGTLLINAIAPIRPPSLAQLSSAGAGSSQRDSPTLFIDGARNAARPFEVVPAILGVHRQVPPLGSKSYTEVIGDDHYIRMLVVWGIGPLKIENIRIGETPIENFEGVTIETNEGRAGDPKHTIFPDTVTTIEQTVLLKQANDWETRNATPDADELSVDFTFPRGLVSFGAGGGRGNRTVAVQLQYRPLNGGSPNPWLTPTFTAKTVDDEWIDGDTITFTHNRSSAVRHGFRWSLPARGDYEVRARRTTSDTESTQIFDETLWTALRRVKNVDPLNFPVPVASTALLIKATDQLNRAVDELNATVSSYVDAFDGTDTWAEAVSSNPADLYRHVLQGPGNAKALADTRVNIDDLEAWWTFCAENNFEFNMIRDFQSSVWDTLADIAAAGRASPAMIDGKWTVVVDKPQTLPVQHFTPRNSWGFEAERALNDMPHAFRIRFNNREKDWRNDERIVYADGYNANSAQEFIGLDFVGKTHPDHVWKDGRFHLAQSILRPERYNLNCDFEYLVSKRGDLCLITHDVLLVGLASGRVKSVITGGSPLMITGVTIDETVTMEDAKNYGIAIRTVENSEIIKQVVTSVGAQTTLNFMEPFAAGTIESGDLFGFGPLGNESLKCLLLSIEPTDELSARLTFIPYSEAIYTADQGTIPAFDSKLTPQSGVPSAVISNIRSDESVLQLGAGNTLIPHASISLRPVTDQDVEAQIQLRTAGTNEPFYDAIMEGRNGWDYLIGAVEQNRKYDFRARWLDTTGQRLPGMFSYVYGHRIVGKSTNPTALQGANISVYNGNALIRWNPLQELDVRFGGEVRFRHSPNLNASEVEWSASTSIGLAARGNTTQAQLPLKAGTYLARVYDKELRYSEFVALSTKQASVLTYAAVDEVIEAPNFTGVHDGTVKVGSTLRLIGTGLFDDIADFDALADLDSFGGIGLEGHYYFGGVIAFDDITKVRLTANIDALSINILDRIDSRTTPIDTWEDFDGTNQSAADCRIQVSYTDDHTASPVEWSPWNYLDSAEFQNKAFKFRAILTTNDPAFNISVSTLGVIAEVI